MWRYLTKEWIVSQIIKNQHKIDTTPTPLAVRPLAEVRAGCRLPPPRPPPSASSSPQTRLASRPSRCPWRGLTSCPVPLERPRSSAATAGHPSEPSLLFICKVPLNQGLTEQRHCLKRAFGSFQSNGKKKKKTTRKKREGPQTAVAGAEAALNKLPFCPVKG